MKKPTFSYERALIQQGYTCIVGVDEAGAGALAGPVVAAAVCLPLNSRLGDIHDSKKLSLKKREELYLRIQEKATSFAVGSASVEEISALNIRQANYLAMKRAIEAITDADYALVDAWTVPNLSIAQQGVVKGDQQVKSIAAASILAKVSRDRMMQELDEQFPVYGFAKHKGYGTQAHRDAIAKHGPCAAHRLTYKTFQ